MGILYMLVDHKNKRYFDFNKFSVVLNLDWSEVKTRKDAKEMFLASTYEQWPNDFRHWLIHALFTRMELPFECLDDASREEEWERVKENYECVGARFEPYEKGILK